MRFGALVGLTVGLVFAFTTAAFAATPGFYEGNQSNNGNGLTFFVSASGTEIQDIVVRATDPLCPPPKGGGLPYHLGIEKAVIEPSGHFKAEAKQSGVYGKGEKVVIADVFEGNFSGESASGTYSETVAVTEGGKKYDCKTKGPGPGEMPTWETTKKEALSVVSPLPGSYAGTYNTESAWPVSFKVSSSGKTVEDFASPHTNPKCTNGEGVEDPGFKLVSVPIKADGEFVKTVKEEKSVDENPSITGKFVYWASGRLHGIDSSGKERVGGQYREEVKFIKAGKTITCSTLKQSWLAQH